MQRGRAVPQTPAPSGCASRGRSGAARPHGKGPAGAGRAPRSAGRPEPLRAGSRSHCSGSRSRTPARADSAVFGEAAGELEPPLLGTRFQLKLMFGSLRHTDRSSPPHPGLGRLQAPFRERHQPGAADPQQRPPPGCGGFRPGRAPHRVNRLHAARLGAGRGCGRAARPALPAAAAGRRRRWAVPGACRAPHLLLDLPILGDHPVGGGRSGPRPRGQQRAQTQGPARQDPRPTQPAPPGRSCGRHLPQSRPARTTRNRNRHRRHFGRGGPSGWWLPLRGGAACSGDGAGTGLGQRRLSCRQTGWPRVATSGGAGSLPAGVARPPRPAAAARAAPRRRIAAAGLCCCTDPAEEAGPVNGAFWTSSSHR